MGLMILLSNSNICHACLLILVPQGQVSLVLKDLQLIQNEKLAREIQMVGKFMKITPGIFPIFSCRSLSLVIQSGVEALHMALRLLMINNSYN